MGHCRRTLEREDEAEVLPYVFTFLYSWHYPQNEDKPALLMVRQQGIFVWLRMLRSESPQWNPPPSLPSDFSRSLLAPDYYSKGWPWRGGKQLAAVLILGIVGEYRRFFGLGPRHSPEQGSPIPLRSRPRIRLIFAGFLAETPAVEPREVAGIREAGLAGHLATVGSAILWAFIQKTTHYPQNEDER